MCGIAGFCNTKADFTRDAKWTHVLQGMKTALAHRGPNENGEFLCPQTGFAHTRLSIIDLGRGQQPMTREHFGCSYTIVYNGEPPYELLYTKWLSYSDICRLKDVE